MANPNEVEHSQTFKNLKVIYNKDGFSMCIGNLFAKPNPILAFRYNGEEGKAGFPYAFNHPLWMPIPEDLSEYFLQMLLRSDFLDEEGRDAIEQIFYQYYTKYKWADGNPWGFE